MQIVSAFMPSSAYPEVCVWAMRRHHPAPVDQVAQPVLGARLGLPVGRDPRRHALLQAPSEDIAVTDRVSHKEDGTDLRLTEQAVLPMAVAR